MKQKSLVIVNQRVTVKAHQALHTPPITRRKVRGEKAIRFAAALRLRLMLLPTAALGAKLTQGSGRGTCCWSKTLAASAPRRLMAPSHLADAALDLPLAELAATSAPDTAALALALASAASDLLTATPPAPAGQWWAGSPRCPEPAPLGWAPAAAAVAYASTARPLADLALDLDPLVLVGEATALALALAAGAAAPARLGRPKPAYAAVVAALAANNISVTEVASVATLVGTLAIFDVFVAASEDDVVDAAAYAVFGAVALALLALAVVIDVQYCYMVSGVGGSDPLLRVLAADVANNALCALRVFFCWVRYVFYDMQVELVDLSAHYTDPANEAAIADALGLAQAAWEGGAQPEVGQPGLLVQVIADTAFNLAQIVLSVFKFAIATFLLWLISDLFVVKAIARSEALGLGAARDAHRSA